MSKKAFLVSFEVRTRVIIEDGENEGEIIHAAITRILNNGAGSYIDGDNCTEIIEDTECPYDPKTDDQ